MFFFIYPPPLDVHGYILAHFFMNWRSSFCCFYLASGCVFVKLLVVSLRRIWFNFRDFYSIKLRNLPNRTKFYNNLIKSVDFTIEFKKREAVSQIWENNATRPKLGSKLPQCKIIAVEWHFTVIVYPKSKYIYTLYYFKHKSYNIWTTII